MKEIKKFFKKFLIRLQIIKELFQTLWKYKLWWGMPILFVILILLVLLFVAGNTGVVAFLYPLF